MYHEIETERKVDMLVKVDNLNKMFNKWSGKEKIDLEDRCGSCGCSVILEITSISGGYGIMGGANKKVKETHSIVG